MILLPPDAPAMAAILLFLFITMVGLMEDMGLLPGTMKLVGEAAYWYALSVPVVEKSSISLLKIIPVRFPRTLLPKLYVCIEGREFDNTCLM